MSYYNTGNPVPSIDPRDLDDNAKVFDELLQSDAASVPDRTGVLRKTYKQMERDAEGLVSPPVAALAATVPAANKGLYYSAGSPAAMGTYDLSLFFRNLGGSVDAAALRTAANLAKSGANTDITSITGSAATLGTPRTIVTTGDATWSVSFDGSANVTGALTLANTGVVAGTYSQVIVNAKGQVTSGVANTTFANLTLQNSWTVISGRRAAYRKVLDMVQIDFQAINGTATNGTLLATLPAGFRPPFPVATPVVSGPNTALSASIPVPRVIIDVDGSITCQNCSSVSGIGFTVMIPTV